MAGRLQLYIDDREHNILAKLGMSKSGTVATLLPSQQRGDADAPIVDEVIEDGFCIKRKRLIAGDFVIVDTNDGHYVAIIERKTYSDMADSIKGERKANYGKMTAIRDGEIIKNHTSPKLILLLEGSLRTSDTEKENGISIRAMESHMMHLMLRDGFCIWHTASADDTFRWLMNALRSTGTLLASAPSQPSAAAAAAAAQTQNTLSALPTLPVPPITASQPKAAAVANRVAGANRKKEFIERYQNDAEFRSLHLVRVESASEQLPSKAKKPSKRSKPSKAEAERAFALSEQVAKTTNVSDWLNKTANSAVNSAASTSQAAPVVLATIPQPIDETDTKSEIITSKILQPSTREVISTMLSKIPGVGPKTVEKFAYKIPIGELLVKDSPISSVKADADIRKKYSTAKAANNTLDITIIASINGITVAKVNTIFTECAVASIEELARVSLEKLQEIKFGTKRAPTVMRRLYDCIHYVE